MKKPIMVRPLTKVEQAVIEHRVHSPSTFTVRRCQILVASARRHTPPVNGQNLGCSDEAVRPAICAFHRQGGACLTPKSRRPHTLATQVTPDQAHAVADLGHHSPRKCGQPTSIWTLDLAVQVSQEQGVLAQPVSVETMRPALLRLGIAWRWAKHWITSAESRLCAKKNARDRLVVLAKGQKDGVFGFADEVWWSRMVLPALPTFGEQPLRLIERSVPPSDPDSPALACYGIYFRHRDQAVWLHDELWLRFVEQRPISALSEVFLHWVCQQLVQRGKHVLDTDVGQRFLACEQTGAVLDSRSQPLRQAAGQRGADHPLSAPYQESLAQLH